MNHDQNFKNLILDYLRPSLGDLGRLPVDDYLDSRNVVSRILLPLMKYARGRRVEVCLRALEGLIALEPNWDKRLKYGEFVTQYAKLKGSEKAELQHRLAQRQISGGSHGYDPRGT